MVVKNVVVIVGAIVLIVLAMQMQKLVIQANIIEKFIIVLWSVFLLLIILVMIAAMQYKKMISRNLIIDFFRPDRPNSIIELLIQAKKEEKELIKYKIQTADKKELQKTGIILGKQPNGRYFASPEMEEGNCLVTGFPGTGKTTGILIPTLLNFKGRVFAIDISGDITKVVKRPRQYNYRPAEGIGIYDVFFNVHRANNRAERLEQLALIAQLLLPEDISVNENGKFFRDNGRKMLNAALIYYYQIGLDFGEMCLEICSLNAEQLLTILREEEELRDLILPLISSFEGANEKNTQGCKQAVDDVLTLFATNENVRKTLRTITPEKGKIGVAPFILEFYDIFIIIPQEKLSMYQPLLRLITGQMLSYFTSRDLRSDIPILMALDEFGRLGHISGIVDALGTLRKRKIRLLLMTQTIPDLDKVYGVADREAILGNCSFTVCLGAKDKVTQEYFANAVGKHYKSRYGANMGNESGDRYSITETENYIVEPASLAYLNAKKELLILTPKGYSYLQKIYWFEEDYFKKIVIKNRERLKNKTKVNKKGKGVPDEYKIRKLS